MAHLRPGERGQLLLVGGIVVAFAIVGVAIVLNTVVLTETLESRDPPRDLDRAREHAAVVEQAAERIVRTGEDTEHPNWTAARTNATTDVARLGSLLGNRTLQGDAAYTNTTVAHSRRGAAIEQTDAGRNFTSAGGDADWTLANTTGIRNYRMQVAAEDLTAVNDTLSTDPTLPDGIPGFAVNVTGAGGTTWEGYLTATTNDTVRVVTQDDDGTRIACVSATNDTTVDWTNGSVGGEACDFTFAHGLSGPYTLGYEDGDEAAGEYHLVVSNTTSDTVEVGNFAAGGGDPRQYPAVYALVVTAVYDGPAVSRETDVRVAPGEPPEMGPA